MSAWEDPLGDLIAFCQPGLESGNPMIAQDANRTIGALLGSSRVTTHSEAPMRPDGSAEPPAGIPADGEEGAIRQQGWERPGNGSTEQEPGPHHS